MSSRLTTAAAPGSSDLGAKLVALAGLGLVGYGLMFLIRNFTGFIELGLTPQHVGGTPEQIRAFNPYLYNYISHPQVPVAAFIIALGVAVIALAWQGIRTRSPGSAGPSGQHLSCPSSQSGWPCLFTTSMAWRHSVISGSSTWMRSSCL